MRVTDYLTGDNLEYDITENVDSIGSKFTVQLRWNINVIEMNINMNITWIHIISIISNYKREMFLNNYRFQKILK